MAEQQYGYGRDSVDRLVEGAIRGIRGYTIEVEPSWAEIRADIERSGDIEDGGFVEVLDLELAVSALRVESPKAALVTLAKMFGFENDEIEAAFRDRRPVHKAKEDAKHFVIDWLSGDDAVQGLNNRRRRGSNRRGAA